MRQLTAYASYLDNLGAPLVGRARFYNLDGSEAVVYSLDNATQTYEEIGAIVFTNSSGQLEPQVFLADHDYLVVFDKYIGAGTMSEDDDSESWEEQGSAVDRYNTLGITLEGDSVRCIATMADLRSTTAVSGDHPEVVLLLGYNESGDKEPIYYKWNAYNTGSPISDDGGSVVKVSGVDLGRWEMVGCPRYLDVRHFGAFPMQGIVPDQAQNNAIQLAGNYAHSNNCGLYFDTTPTAAYYDISGLTLYDVDSNPDAECFAKTGESSTVNGIVSIHLVTDTGCTGRIDLNSEELRTSWSQDSTFGRFMQTSRLVVDAKINYGVGVPVTFTNLRVDILTDPGDTVTFDNCHITAIGAISGPIDIENCELKTEWFEDNYDWDDLVSIGNTILLRNCKDADTYILLKNKQSEVDYGDLGEQQVTDAAFGAGALVENCYGTASLAGDAELHNVTLELTSVANSSSINAVDAWLTLDSAVVLAGLQILRGSITGPVNVIINGDTRLEDTAVDVTLVVHDTDPVYINCVFNSNFTQFAEYVDLLAKYVLGGRMEHCELNAVFSLGTVDTGIDTLARFVWKDNHATVANPINVADLVSHLDNTNQQEYTYEGNTGTFLKTRAPAVFATSFTTNDPGNHGWVVSPDFDNQDVELFVVGKRKVKCTNHFRTGSKLLGMEEMSGTIFTETATGLLAVSDYSSSILMAPLNDGINSMYDMATNGIGTFWVDLEVL